MHRTIHSNSGIEATAAFDGSRTHPNAIAAADEHSLVVDSSRHYINVKKGTLVFTKKDD